MKKILALLLAMAMMIALAACGGDKPTTSPSGSPDPSESPSQSSEPEDERLVKDRDASKEDIIGNWDFIAQKTDGEWKEVVDQTFTFEETRLSYSVYPSDITFEGNVISVLGWACTMTAWFNQDGQLVLEDSRGPIYLCDNHTELSENSEQPAGDSFTAADLLGTWSLYAWDLTVGGMYTEEVNDFYVFTGDTVTYVDNNTEKGVWDYKFTDENTMALSNASSSTSWDLSYGENGELVITDPAAYLVYYCRKSEQARTAPAPSQEPAGNRFTSADLVGTWSLYAWDLTIGGMYTEEVNDFYVFTENTLTYIDNNVESGVWNYEFTDENSMNLSNANGSTSWDLSYGENGELVITDPALYVVYYCTRAN